VLITYRHVYKCFTQVRSVLLEFTAVVLSDLILPICPNLKLAEMLGDILKYAQYTMYFVHLHSYLDDESARNNEFTQCHGTKTQAN